MLFEQKNLRERFRPREPSAEKNSRETSLEPQRPADLAIQEQLGATNESAINGAP